MSNWVWNNKAVLLWQVKQFPLDLSWVKLTYIEYMDCVKEPLIILAKQCMTRVGYATVGSVYVFKANFKKSKQFPPADVRLHFKH